VFRTLSIVVAVGLIAGLVYLFRLDGERAFDREPALSLVETLSGDAEGFTRALEPRAFMFPDDHGPHPDFRTEWWYYTGNLASASGRKFGFQFTLFRSALTPTPEERESTWAANQVYMAHLALTDVESERFYAFQRFSRGAAGLAGAQADPLRLWLEDWRIEEAGPGRFPDVPVMHLTAAIEEGAGLDLYLDSAKPMVLQGDRGLSRKGSEPGNASYYYSLTRLEAKGEIRLPDGGFEVTGWAWMDREWSTSVLEEGQVGWDWFAMQLDSGEEVMFYRMRRSDGTADPHSSGCWVDAEGRSTYIAAKDVDMEVLETWTNRDGDEYPSRWRLSFPDRDSVLGITPLLADQELRFDIQYWEGAVSIQGTRGNQPLSGRGYVELTGYAGEARGR
jgi:predicted secreted hydrolase